MHLADGSDSGLRGRRGPFLPFPHGPGGDARSRDSRGIPIAGDWETPSPQTLTPDSSQVIGEVEYVEFPALLDGIEASVNDDIHPRSVIETHERGIADFHTDDVAGCDTRGDSQLQIRPDDRLAIKWLPGKSGESFCNKLPGQGKQTYGIGDAIEILMEDPIFGVVFVEDGTVVKIVQGFADVTVIDRDKEESFSLKTGEELFVPVEGMPVKHSLELSREQQFVVSRLEQLTVPADLVARFDDFASDPEQDACTIRYTVSNVGRGAAGPSLTRVMLGNEVSRDEPTPALAAGDSVSLSTILPSACPFDPDLHGALAVDVDDRVAESNEQNNTTPIDVIG